MTLLPGFVTVCAQVYIVFGPDGGRFFQTAVAAGVAWFLAVLILGHERPEFAPIAAVISLGLAVGERSRRVLELTLGVAFGVTIADALVSVIGVGAAQTGVVVALAMAAAVFCVTVLARQVRSADPVR